jgi:predicted nucleic acid-binding protein
VTHPSRPRIFVDADVIFAGSAAPSEHGASLVLLRLAELTLIECVTSQQAITEVERNLSAKLPTKVATFRTLVSRCLQVIDDPEADEVARHVGQADPKDLPLLVAAQQSGCRRLVTFNLRHYWQPQDLIVQTPGDCLRDIRSLLAAFGR